MVRAVICCWQCNCLAVLSFSQRSVGKRTQKPKTTRREGREWEFRSQLIHLSAEVEPLPTATQKSLSSKAPKHSSQGLALRTLRRQECCWAFTWEGTQGMFRSAAIQTLHSPSENRVRTETTSKGHYCPASFLPTFKSCFFSFLGSATFSDTAAHHKITKDADTLHIQTS